MLHIQAEDNEAAIRIPILGVASNLDGLTIHTPSLAITFLAEDVFSFAVNPLPAKGNRAATLEVIVNSLRTMSNFHVDIERLPAARRVTIAELGQAVAA